MKKGKIFLTMGLVAIIATTVGAATGIKISAELLKQNLVLNGEQNVEEVINYKGTTYVPLRKLSTMLGAQVSYNDGTIYVVGEGFEEFSVAIPKDWQGAGTETGYIYLESDKYSATASIGVDISEEYGSLTIDDYAQLITDTYTTDGAVIEVQSIEEVAGKKIAYFEIAESTELGSGKNIEAYLIEGEEVYQIVIVKDDNGEVKELKDELLKIVEGVISEL